MGRCSVGAWGIAFRSNVCRQTVVDEGIASCMPVQVYVSRHSVHRFQGGMVGTAWRMPETRGRSSVLWEVVPYTSEIVTHYAVAGFSFVSSNQSGGKHMYVFPLGSMVYPSGHW